MTTPRLEDRIARARALRVHRVLRAKGAPIPGAAAALGLLRACLRENRPEARRRLLLSPLLGGWTQDVLFWSEILRRADRLSRGEGGHRARMRLFDLVARSDNLVEIVPKGRLDRRFARRAASRGRRILRERMEDLPRILLPHLPRSFGVRRFDLVAREIPDEGCPPDRIRFGELPILLAGRRKALPRRIRVRLARGTLRLPGGIRLEPHPRIPGSRILLGRRLISRPRTLRVGSEDPRTGRRLGRALAIVGRAWPEATRMISRRTWLVVPLEEPGTVSYSHLSRPGISYINARGKGLVDLADDLLHESAHHLLHAAEETVRFCRDDGEPRYFSPWRRTMRPLRGILHGTFTFLFRAELLLRLARMGSSGEPAVGKRRSWIRSEARREIADCGEALECLVRARREGLLTREGVLLLGRMRRRQRSLARGGLSEPRASSIV